MLRNVVRSVVKNIPRTGKRSYSYDAINYKPPSMDDLPIPQGCWQEAYDKKQKVYNMRLIGGILFATGTIVVAKVSGLVYLNWYPPTPKEK